MCNVTIRTATCACGRLSIRCLGEPTNVSLCHCLACQKRTGSTYGVAAFFWRKAVEPQGATRSYARQSDFDHPESNLLDPSGPSREDSTWAVTAALTWVLRSELHLIAQASYTDRDTDLGLVGPSTLDYQRTVTMLGVNLSF